MRGFELIASRSPVYMSFGNNTKLLEAHNIERVRSYLERNLGCSRKEVMCGVGLSSRTVAKAIRIIRNDL